MSSCWWFVRLKLWLWYSYPTLRHHFERYFQILLFMGHWFSKAYSWLSWNNETKNNHPISTLQAAKFMTWLGIFWVMLRQTLATWKSVAYPLWCKQNTVIYSIWWTLPFSLSCGVFTSLSLGFPWLKKQALQGNRAHFWWFSEIHCQLKTWGNFEHIGSAKYKQVLETITLAKKPFLTKATWQLVIS